VFVTYGSPFSRHKLELSLSLPSLLLPPSTTVEIRYYPKEATAQRHLTQPRWRETIRKTNQDGPQNLPGGTRRISRVISVTASAKRTGQPVATNRVENNNVGVAAEDNNDAGGAVVDVDEGGEEGNGAPIGDNAQANDVDDDVSMNIIN
jgi:hypothetical protein